MSAENIFLEAVKTIGPVGGASVLTAYLFLKYNKQNGNGNGNGNGNKLPAQCPLHSHLEEAQKNLFAKIDDLQKEVSGLPFKFWEIIQKEK